MEAGSTDLEKGVPADYKDNKVNVRTRARKAIEKVLGMEENVGSTARDHLANERTYLAWLRTCMALIGFGILLAMFSEETLSIIAGALFVFLGFFLLIYSVIRYYFVLVLLKHKKFAANAWGLAFVTIVSLVCLLVAGVLVLLGNGGNGGSGGGV
uniref:DUF202 domain-containing protein n=1 Tax=Vannella robusta TaxID=1487602 RepID=A0A7S4HWA8_9EUKA|mmetsp:Transcript_16611/g.21214  ORF Transcript_16611/g.21214 Transcript_16611/m.21214 type:complete len:155 (+) Transcript_16611:280-744(+)|eukprot:CAMPEP_0206193600 /NCGR_PEP_ID=MMETSP0166-20121206/6667_1 /ASSEMBLY_ACC=CAM_ASM_000260 /TAXON_ID=95228 /ORGANISM="Vannella robusta, Strain DIVA3 518/3/11/1/6" /LENGTH=154 /DNA_ID=CAMNT_0053610351 /DNA_START=166 /DNA_END=630 /DNA_ORIENTATION=+